MNALRTLSMVVTAIVFGLSSVCVSAEEYPSKPITWLIPTGPGSGIDSATRYFARKLESDLGQPIVVKNDGAGSGIVALRTVKNAPADGYTLFTSGMSQLIVNPVVRKQLPYDAVHDFKPISGMGKAVFALVVPVQSPIKSLDELIAAGKGGAQLNAGVYSVGYQLYTEWFGAQTGLKFEVANYSGGASSVILDLIGGRLDFALMDAYLAHAQKGKLRALAVTGKERFEHLPDVPTLQELGLEQYVVYVPLSLQVRADTPDNVTKILSEGMRKIVAEPETKEFLSTFGMTLVTESPEEIAKYEADQRALLTQIVHDIGFEVQ